MSSQLLLENQLCFRIYSLEKAISKAYGPLLKELQLTYPQYLVMLVLWQQQTITVNQLAKQLNLDTGTLSPLLKRMERSDLLTRQRSQNDERKVIIELTAHGKHLKHKAKLIPAKMLNKTGFPTPQLQALASTLDQLLININHQ